MTGSNLVVRRAALEAIGGFDEDLMASNDRDLWFRLLQSGATYGVVDERLVYQRTHQLTSRIATSDPRKLVALHRYRDKHAEHLDAAGRRRLARADRAHGAALRPFVAGPCRGVRPRASRPPVD